MSSIENLHTFYINTKNRTNLNDWIWNFNYNLDIEDNILPYLTHVSISNLSMCKSYFMIRPEFNTFQLYENATNIAITNVVIVSGTYTKNQFYIELGAQLTNASLAAGNNLTYTVLDTTINDVNNNNNGYGRMTIHVAANSTLNDFFITVDKKSVMQEILGSNDKNNNNNVGVVSGVTPNIIGTLTMSNCYSFSPEWQIFLISDITQQIYSNYTSELSNVLTSINTWLYPYSNYIVQNYDIVGNKKRFCMQNKIFNFKLMNEFGQIMDLNGIDFSFVLHIFTYVRPSLYYNSMENSMKQLVLKK